MTVFILGAHPMARDRALREVRNAPDGYRVKVEPAKRSLEQNSRLWSLLEITAARVIWHGQKLSKEEWKDIFSAALKQQKVVPGLSGGFVVLGTSTSRMTKAEMCDLQTLIEAFLAERGIDLEEHWSGHESATA